MVSLLDPCPQKNSNFFQTTKAKLTWLFHQEDPLRSASLLIQLVLCPVPLKQSNKMSRKWFLQSDIPGIRIAVFAHGDYCDRHSSYVTKHIDFSTDLQQLCDWVKDVGSTWGGDSDECYELVLHEMQSLPWTPGTQRALVMIGDTLNAGHTKSSGNDGRYPGRRALKEPW